MRNVHGDFIWYELMTPDPDAAARFYGAVVGWSSHGFGDDGSGYRVFAAAGADVAGLLQTPEDAARQGARPSWFGYVGVDDVDATAAKMVDGGGAQFVPPTDIPGVGRFAMMADPQGATVYLMRGEPDQRSDAFSSTASGHCQWNELATSDPTAALAFYGDLFGWRKGDAMPMGELGEYRFIDHHGETIGAVMSTMNDMPPAWLFYFGVDDIDTAAAAILSHGGTIHHGPASVPGGRIVVASDPQGAMFGIVMQA